MARKYYMVLNDYPDHALALGCLLGHLGELEACLMRMTQFLLQADTGLKAQLIYKEFFSIKNKIKLLKRLNQLFPPNTIVQDEIDELLSKAQRINDRRNLFIHARWNSEAGYGETSNKLMRISLANPGKISDFNKKPTYLTPKNIWDFGEEIATLSQSFEDLLCRVGANS